MTGVASGRPSALREWTMIASMKLAASAIGTRRFEPLSGATSCFELYPASVKRSSAIRSKIAPAAPIHPASPVA